MTEFQLDTSGTVADYRKDGQHTLADVGVVLPGTPQINIDRAERLRAGWSWPDLSPFVQGYVEALLRSSRTLTKPPEHCVCGMSRGWFVRIDEMLSERPYKFAQGPDFRCPDCKRVSQGIPVGYSDLDPETLARIIEDCAWFLGLEAVKLWFPEAINVDGLGRSYWNSRNMPPPLPGHSCFAWADRRAGVLRAMEDAAHSFPPLTLSLGDDGKVVFNG